jgi:hypothetical protein
MNPEDLDAAVAEKVRKTNERLAIAKDKLADAVRDARAAGASWQFIGDLLGVSRQAAHERFGKVEAVQGTMLTDAQREQVTSLFVKAKDVEWLNAHFFSVGDDGQIIKRAARREV